MRRLAALLLPLALAACSKKQTPAPVVESTVPDTETTDDSTAADPADARLESLVERSLVFMSQMADVISANTSDCHAMAAAMNQLITQNQPLVDEGNALSKDAQHRASEIMEKHGDELTANTERMAPGMEACRDDSDVQDAFRRMDHR